MAEVQRVGPLVDVVGEAGTNAGGMIAKVRQSMADLSGHELADVRIKDLLAIDTLVPQEVRGGVAGEVALENAVALAAMVRTRESGMQAVADAVAAHLREAGASRVEVVVGGVEAEMAVLGALTTPGTDKPLVVLDLGGGSTDAALISTDGRVDATHLAGAGDLVSKLIDAELGLGNLELAEEIKRCPLAKAESFFHVRLENGTVQFFETPLSPTAFARVITLGEGGMSPIPTRHSLDRIRRVRRTAKERVFVVNALRSLRAIAPGGDLRQIGFVVLLGGCALDFEIPDLIADALAPFGIVCGTGNVRGTQGPRNAVASGLVAAYVTGRNVVDVDA
jgi:diol dehydratase reactivase alpha subunit